MKKSIFFIFLLILSGAILQAQTYEESIRHWSDGPLKWEELNLKSPRDYSTCDLRFRWISDTQKIRVSWNTVTLLRTYSLALDKSISWHNLDRISPNYLLYDQTIFDLNELYLRKTLKEFYGGNERNLNTLYSFYADQCRSRWTDILEGTSDGADSTMVVYYAKQVSDELSTTPAPQNLSNPQKTGSILSIGVGYTCSLFLGDAANTFSPAHGLYICGGIGIKRHEVDLFMTVGSGTLLRDYDNKGYHWQRGTRADHGYIGGSYGYRLYDGGVFAIKPFVGVASRRLNMIDKAVDEKFRTSGQFVVLGGAEIHFKFARSFILQTSSGFEHCLSFRAFVARDFGPLHATSVNFGIGYTPAFVEIK